jgi:uncharacterized damage-inducible protein DinB
MIRKCFESLSAEDIWERPNKASNSIGNLMLHLKGNITQYAIAGLGGEEDIRDREGEFNATSGYGKDELLRMLGDTLERAKSYITGCGVEELLRIRQVQGFHMSGTGIIVHVVEHLSYHTGQIAFWTKILKDKDLGFYEGRDLNIKNG